MLVFVDSATVNTLVIPISAVVESFQSVQLNANLALVLRAQPTTPFHDAFVFTLSDAITLLKAATLAYSSTVRLTNYLIGMDKLSIPTLVKGAIHFFSDISLARQIGANVISVVAVIL